MTRQGVAIRDRMTDDRTHASDAVCGRCSPVAPCAGRRRARRSTPRCGTGESAGRGRRMRLGRNGKKKEPQSFADMLEAEAKRQGVRLPKDVLKRARELPPMKIVDDPEEL